jgi:transposase
MFHDTFGSVDLASFCGLDEMGLVPVGQRLEEQRAVLECRIGEVDIWCRRCGCAGQPRDSVIRRLAHEPLGWRPTTLLVHVRRWRCPYCRAVWRQDMSKAAEPRSKLTRRGLRWALEGIVVQHLTVARVAEGLSVAWNTANDAILDEGRRVLIDDPARFDGVAVIGVDEHVWRHTRRGDKYVTVIIDLTPVRNGTGPARLLDMVEGRSKKAFKDWLAARPQAWRDRVEVVAMDGFVGFKTAAVEELPQAVEVMDPFHVVRLAGEALDKARQRVQRETLGHRGRARDPLFKARRTLQTGVGLLNDKQQAKLSALFVNPAHGPVKVAWAVYQDLIAAYCEPDQTLAAQDMKALIATITVPLPPALAEVRQLGATLKKRAPDILAYFDRPGTSNGPTEAINGRLEHLRGSALGFRNLTNYIARSLLEIGGFKPKLHPRL